MLLQSFSFRYPPQCSHFVFHRSPFLHFLPCLLHSKLALYPVTLFCVLLLNRCCLLPSSHTSQHLLTPDSSCQGRRRLGLVAAGSLILPDTTRRVQAGLSEALQFSTCWLCTESNTAIIVIRTILQVLYWGNIVGAVL